MSNVPEWLRGWDLVCKWKSWPLIGVRAVRPLNAGTGRAYGHKLRHVRSCNERIKILF